MIEKTDSGDIFTNAISLDLTMPAAEGNESEMIMPLLEEAVGFTLNTSQTEGVTWYAKAGDGEYQQITPGELTYVLNLNKQQIAASVFHIKAAAEDPALLENVACTMQFAVMEKERPLRYPLPKVTGLKMSQRRTKSITRPTCAGISRKTCRKASPTKSTGAP